MRLKNMLFGFISLAILASCQVNTPSENSGGNSNENTNNQGNSGSENSTTLVVYYSATGTTEKIAKLIQNKTNGTLFEIEPVNEYTSADLNYNNQESRVSKEHNDESLRDVALKKSTPDNFSSYDNVFIGYPIWWGIAAWPINNFVKDNDLSGKKIIPFATSASSGLGNSVNLLKAMNNTGDWDSGRRFSSSTSQSNIDTWIDGLGL